MNLQAAIDAPQFQHARHGPASFYPRSRGPSQLVDRAAFPGRDARGIGASRPSTSSAKAMVARAALRGGTLRRPAQGRRDAALHAGLCGGAMTLFSAQDYQRLAAAYAAAREANAIFGAVETLVRERIGYGLLTMLKLEADAEHVTRIFTTNERAYPLTGSEALGSTAWGDHVLRKGSPFLGPDKAAVRWAFPGDYELIESLGLGATMNVPITLLGRTLGSMNILDAEHRYSAQHLIAVSTLAPFLVAAFVDGGKPLG